MELKEFANLIDGRQYDYRMFTKEELQLAKDNRIVIVTGASDDLVELEGAITDIRTFFQEYAAEELRLQESEQRNQYRDCRILQLC